MYSKVVSAMIAMAAVASAQTYERRAVLVGGGDRDRGQCTVEVVVDGAAQVEVRSGYALLRNLSGQPPQWRRFECTSMMPANPTDFRFVGVDGRGRQQLIGDPRNGGVAVVRIDDPDNGSEGYTFRLVWNGFASAPDPEFSRRGYNQSEDMDDYDRGREAWFRGNNWRGMLFQRVRQDVEHVTSGAFPFTGDRARLMQTERELDELQQKLSRGFYDERELDEVTSALQAVLQMNRLAPRDRAILADDLDRMQDFRARHDQYGARDDDSLYHRDREQPFIGDSWRMRFFQRIREDLDHATMNGSPFRGDQSRLARTQHELDELQEKLSRGYYDERELDEVMSALRDVIESNRLRGGDRDMLIDDLKRMREFRIRHEQLGAR